MECIFVLDSNTVGEKGWQPELPRPRKFGKKIEFEVWRTIGTNLANSSV